MTTELFIAWTTVGSEAAAKKLAHKIVEKSLAACVQIEGPVQSVYHWNEAVQEESEWRLMIKFTGEQSDRLNDSIREFHPYDIPEWIVTKADRVAPGYLKWASKSH